MSAQEDTLVALDCGNANVKITDGVNINCFPHALKKMTEIEVQEYEARGELSVNPDIYRVNKKYYMIGSRAIRRGAGEVLFGENRYVPEYYGVLAAIATFRLLDKSNHNILLIGEHTPKDIIYRQDLINSVLLEKVGVWHVASGGVKKSFSFKAVKGYDEPNGIFRYATLQMDETLRVTRLDQGRCCILDLGGFTTGVSVTNDGHVDYDRIDSLPMGMLDLEDELAKLLKREHKDLLRGLQWLEPLYLRSALANPEVGYNARSRGYITCVEEVESVFNGFMRKLSAAFMALEGGGAFDTVLLGGGGTGSAEQRIRKTLGHRNVFLADNDLSVIHEAGVKGAWIAANILNRRGLLVK